MYMFYHMRELPAFKTFENESVLLASRALHSASLQVELFYYSSLLTFNKGMVSVLLCKFFVLLYF